VSKYLDKKYFLFDIRY